MWRPEQGKGSTVCREEKRAGLAREAGRGASLDPMRQSSRLNMRKGRRGPSRKWGEKGVEGVGGKRSVFLILSGCVGGQTSGSGFWKKKKIPEGKGNCQRRGSEKECFLKAGRGENLGEITGERGLIPIRKGALSVKTDRGKSRFESSET